MKVRKIIQQLLPSNTEQFVAWDVADYDVGGWFNFVFGQVTSNENAFRITAPVDGVYEILLNLLIAPGKTVTSSCGTTATGAPVNFVEVLRKGLQSVFTASPAWTGSAETELKGGEWVNVKVSLGEVTTVCNDITESMPSCDFVMPGSTLVARWIYGIGS